MQRIPETEVPIELRDRVLALCRERGYVFRGFSKGMGGTQISFVCPEHGLCSNKAWKFIEIGKCRKCETHSRQRQQAQMRSREYASQRVSKARSSLTATLACLTVGRLLETPTTQYTPVSWVCNCGNRNVKPTSPYRLARLKYGCRTCANEATNAQKREQPVQAPEVIKRLRRKFPTLTVAYISSRLKASTEETIVHYLCPQCGSKDRIYLKNLKHAPTACRKCQPVAVINKNSFQMKHARDRESGKVFLVQGYELDALKILKARGCALGELKASQEISAISYLFQNKLRKYKPDLQYKNTIIEVKSFMTAGICPQSLPAFEQLKAKAKATEREGKRFYLMLIHKLNGRPVQVRLPSNWSRLSLAALRKRLGLNHERVTRREVSSLDVLT